LARRRFVRRYDIDTVDNAPFLFLSFPPFLFSNFFLFFYYYFFKLLSPEKSTTCVYIYIYIYSSSEALNHASASVLEEAKVTQGLRFFTAESSSLSSPIVVYRSVHSSGKTQVERVGQERRSFGQQRERRKERREETGRRPLSLSSECHDCSVYYDFWTNIDWSAISARSFAN
jgi:hypothetical protein